MKEFILTHRNLILGLLFTLLSYGIHLAFRYKNETDTDYPDSLKFQRAINNWFFVILMLVIASGFFIAALPDSNVFRLLVFNNRFPILFVILVFALITIIITRKEWLYVDEKDDIDWYKFYKGRNKRRYWSVVIVMSILTIIFLCQSF